MIKHAAGLAGAGRKAAAMGPDMRRIDFRTVNRQQRGNRIDAPDRHHQQDVQQQPVGNDCCPPTPQTPASPPRSAPSAGSTVFLLLQKPYIRAATSVNGNPIMAASRNSRSAVDLGEAEFHQVGGNPQIEAEQHQPDADAEQRDHHGLAEQPFGDQFEPVALDVRARLRVRTALPRSSRRSVP